MSHWIGVSLEEPAVPSVPSKPELDVTFVPSEPSRKPSGPSGDQRLENVVLFKAERVYDTSQRNLIIYE
jgi:hypothetical protein